MGANDATMSVHVGEARARRALWKEMSTDLVNHSKCHLVAYDGAVTVGAAVKGRSSSGSISRALQRTGVYLLAMDCAEGALWCGSEHNIADSPSRHGPLPMAAPRREWVHQFLEDAPAPRPRRHRFTRVRARRRIHSVAPCLPPCRPRDVVGGTGASLSRGASCNAAIIGRGIEGFRPALVL